MDARAPAPVKERGIIFPPCSVLAILAGRQTMTRRVLRPQPYKLDGRPGFWNASGAVAGTIAINDAHLLSLHRHAAGDRLFVKEAWRTCAGLDDKAPFEIGEACVDAGYSKPWGPVEYVADGARRAWAETDWPTEEAGRLRSAQHMPRWASRIELHVTEVRVERLHSISAEDAIAEGVEPLCHPEGREDLTWVGTPKVCMSPEIAFRHHWDRLHGGGAWAIHNSYVAAIRFERVLAAGWSPVLVAST